jgi:hypothetical protein
MQDAAKWDRLEGISDQYIGELVPIWIKKRPRRGSPGPREKWGRDYYSIKPAIMTTTMGPPRVRAKKIKANMLELLVTYYLSAALHRTLELF